MNLSHKLRVVILLIMLGCTAGCDQTSKHIAQSKLSECGFVSLPGRFGELRLAENPGAFLSLGNSLPMSSRRFVFTIGVAAGLFGLLGYLVLGDRSSWCSFIGFGMAWAGGMSNLIDRIGRDGLVTDFIFIRIGPFHSGIFNLADLIIMIGAAIFMICGWDESGGRIGN
jgi:signal peptidase II